MKNEKWTPNFIFHFSSHFAFAMENTKWETEKSDKNDNAYPGPLAQLLVKLLLFFLPMSAFVGVLCEKHI